MKCKSCENYIWSLDTCKFCHFEHSESVIKDDWDILNLKEEDGWEHLQICDRLHSKGIDCYSADIWSDDMAFLVGCYCDTSELARVLGMHEEAIYNDYEHSLVILNLFQEKRIRKNEKKM